jgi:hypothetical protein
MIQSIRVVCIDNNGMWGYISDHAPLVPLTIGKIYTVENVNNSPDFCAPSTKAYVTNDHGVVDWYNFSRFKLLSDVRKEKLNQLI